jgi:hypothetical protein
MPETSIARDFVAFLKALWVEWRSLLMGGTIFAGFLIWGLIAREAVPLNVAYAALAATFFWASFLAWRKEHKQGLKVTELESSLAKERDRMEGEPKVLLSIKDSDVRGHLAVEVLGCEAINVHLKKADSKNVILWSESIPSLRPGTPEVLTLNSERKDGSGSPILQRAIAAEMFFADIVEEQISSGDSSDVLERAAHHTAELFTKKVSCVLEVCYSDVTRQRHYISASKFTWRAARGGISVEHAGVRRVYTDS